MTADYQSARAAKSGTASQTGAGRAGLCRCSDTRIVVSIDAAGGWIRHGDLAAQVAPEVMRSAMPSRKQRAQGKPGAHDTRSRAQERTRWTAGAPEHPAFPAQWFIGLCRALPGDEFLLPPSLTDWRLIEGPVGPDNLHQLDTSNGCQDHTVLPSAASSCHTPRPARMLPEEVSTEAFKRRSSARYARSRKIRPANTSRARRCRVHRNPSQRS
jgi:hypothetical protein